MLGALHLQLEMKNVSGVSRLHLHNAYENYLNFLHFISSLIQLYIIYIQISVHFKHLVIIVTVF